MVGILLLVIGVDLMFLLELSNLGDELNRWLFQTFGVGLTDWGLRRRVTYQTLIGLPTALLGLVVFLYGVWNALASVTSAVEPAGDRSIVDVIWRRRQLAQGARVVVIGGGTGLSTLLRGLKEYTSNVTAVVAVTDDGGSSGRLLREFNVLPPGDIRNCLVALADAEPTMQQLFQYRFSESEVRSSLEGHSFGNLLILAMTRITGDFEEAVRQTSRVLAIRGRVLPATTRHVSLRAELDDGSVVEGETNVSNHGPRIRRLMLSDPGAEPLEETLDAIRTADAIVIGPGSVYTSILPNLLVKGVADAIRRSPAIRIYVCNVMTQAGETPDFRASDHLRAIFRHAGDRLVDHALVNVEEPCPELRERYAEAGSAWVLPDVDEFRRLGVRPHVGRLINQSSVVRHDPEKLADAIIRLISRQTMPRFWFFDRREWL
jgi:uncharacterized cofD-like protein